MKTKENSILRLAFAALLAALCFVGFEYLRIDIPIGGGETTAIHFGNAFCVLAALLLGGVYGGLAGAVGMTIADIISVVYISSAPKTFFLKFCIGFITGTVAHKLFHLHEETSPAKAFRSSLIAAIAGMAFNVVADPLVGYFYKIVIIGKPAAEVTLAWNVASTSINAVTSTIVSVVVYMALRPALKKAGLFFEIGKKSE